MKRILMLASCSVFVAGMAVAMSESTDGEMKSDAGMMAGTELTEEDITSCKETLAGWSDEKRSKTVAALSGSASKSTADLAAATAAKYAGAVDEEALMALKCKSVLLMEMMQDG